MIIFLKKIIFLAGTIGLIYSLGKNIIDYQKKITFYKNYQEEYQQKLKENQKLKVEIVKALDTNIIEREIRDKLNLLKPDEIAIILPRTTISPIPTPKIDKPPHQQWLELFLK